MVLGKELGVYSSVEQPILVLASATLTEAEEGLNRLVESDHWQ
jgi:hypothetical protein